MKTTKRILYDAARKIKKGWCQKTFCLDKSGREVYYPDENPVKHSLIGALYMAANCNRKSYDTIGSCYTHHPFKVYDAVKKAIARWEHRSIDKVTLAHFCNVRGRTKKDILKVLDLAKRYIH